MAEIPAKLELTRSWINKVNFATNVADPHQFEADPEPVCHLDADPDPTFHFNADPDPDPSFQIKA